MISSGVVSITMPRIKVNAIIDNRAPVLLVVTVEITSSMLSVKSALTRISEKTLEAAITAQITTVVCAAFLNASIKAARDNSR